MGQLDNTIIIGLPDHGADQNKHNQGRLYNYYQEVVSIPLFMRIPAKYQSLADNINPDWRLNVDKPTQNLDLVPTIVDLLGISNHPTIRPILKTLDGSSIFEKLPDERWIFSMSSTDFRPWKPSGFGITMGRHYKYIYFEGQEKLFNLISDPEETRNLLPAKTPKLKSLHSRIKRFIRKSDNAREIYSYRFPDENDPVKELKKTIPGHQLKTHVGITKSDSPALYSDGKKGVFSYGPYVQLPEGYYEFQVHFSSDPEFYTDDRNNYVIGYIDKEKWFDLNAGSFNDANNGMLSIKISVTPDHAEKPLEVVTRISGEEELRIDRIDILEVIH